MCFIIVFAQSASSVAHRGFASWNARHLGATTMAPIVPALAQSESKGRFFTRLGLDPSNPTHKRVYALMKLEAAEGRRRLLESQTSDTAQIHEAAWQREMLRIFEEARPETKAVYQFGHDTADNDVVDNWIIRWLLWHVFRSVYIREARHEIWTVIDFRLQIPRLSEQKSTARANSATASIELQQ